MPGIKFLFLHPLTAAGLAFVAINVLSFATFGWDKLCATRLWRRVPENTLLSLALFGGATGAKAGQYLFRHKTRKEPFRSRLNRIVWLNVLFCGVLLAAVLSLGLGW